MPLSVRPRPEAAQLRTVRTADRRPGNHKVQVIKMRGKKRPLCSLLLATAVPSTVVAFSTHSRAVSSLVHPRSAVHPTCLHASSSNADEYGPLDFAIIDSTHLDNALRPTPLEAISNPRDLLAIFLLSCGVVVAICNITGRYDETYRLWEQRSVALGFVSLVAALVQLRTGYEISPRPRRGVIDDSCMNLYAGLYSGFVSWLALRASSFCPGWVERLDVVLPWLASFVFAFSLAAPIITLVENERSESLDAKKNSSISGIITRLARRSTGISATAADGLRIPPALSDTELFRTKGLLAIGVLGCVFVPDCISFALGSSSWWDRVTATHTSQRLLESSTALFALYSTEASMVATRAANKGVAEYRVMVPVFAGVCLALAIIPCACSLYWLGDDVSFFSFYRE